MYLRGFSISKNNFLVHENEHNLKFIDAFDVKLIEGDSPKSLLQVKEWIDAAGYYVDIDSSDRTIQKKVREAPLAQYNYMMEMLFKLTKKIKKKNKLSTH
nr:threonine--tRNA ligase, mitochondrial 1-like [Tanacetum cinerariifolium]